jgi:hypothetical protein
MKKIIFGLVLLSIAMMSCKKDAPITEPLDYGYAYFPLTVGDSACYQVERIFWNDFDQTIDTTTYLLCEYVESFTTNYAGDSLFRIERMMKPDNTAQWQLDSIWFATRNKREAIRVENNRSFVKMVFPVHENQTWNGNIYNIYDEKIYTCTAVDSAANVNGTYFEKAAYIQQQYSKSLINSDIETEIYAKNIGLVQMYKIHVYKEYNASSGQFEITSGYRYIQNRIH